LNVGLPPIIKLENGDRLWT